MCGREGVRGVREGGREGGRGVTCVCEEVGGGDEREARGEGGARWGEGRYQPAKP